MNKIEYFIGEEYGFIKQDSTEGEVFKVDEDEIRKILCTEVIHRLEHYNTDEEKEKRKDKNYLSEYLGIYYENGGIKSSHFVGQVWLNHPEHNVLQIKPKKDNHIDYFGMILKCLEHPKNASHVLKDCFYIWPEKPPIPVDDLDISREPLLLLISRYLKELSDLCRRHLKRGFPRIERNLNGRCKGSILIKKNLIHNTVRGRLDRVYCQFQVHSMDTPGNQILKAALEQSYRFLRKYAYAESLQTLWGWAAESSGVLSEVTLRRIHPTEFQNMRYAGVMRVYKSPHKIAKMILQALGTDPNSPMHEDMKIQLPPYAIDMNELFERYCEFLLRKKFKESELWVGYSLKDGNNFKSDVGGLRPDFLLTSKQWILDAKYKYLYQDQNNFGWNRDDIEQLCLYSRHIKIRETMNLKENQEPDKLIFLYPDKGQEFNRNNLEIFLKTIEAPPPENHARLFYNIAKVAVPLCKNKSKQ